MRYLVSFFLISSILFLIPSLNASPDRVDSVNNTRETTHPSLESHGGFIEGPNYLFESIKTHKFFSANFEQITIHDEKRRLVRGKIIANRSGKFKISYYEPLNEIMFSDGKDFYRYDPELEQVNVQPLDELLSETPIGLFTLNLEEIKELFVVKDCESNLNSYSCQLTSKKEESFIRWINITIKNSVFYSLRYLDSFGQIVSLKFKEASLSEIPTEEFKLIIPEGTDIVSFRDNAQ